MYRLSIPCGFLVLVGLVACRSSQEEVSVDEVFLEAESQFNQAELLLEEGEILRSWAAMGRALGLVDSYLEGNGSASGANWHHREEQVMGLTLPEWREEWRKRYGLKVQMSWSAIVGAVEDESVDFSRLKGFADEFLGSDYVATLNEEHDRLRPVFEERRGEQYWFTCEDEVNLCALVLEGVVAKMPDKMVTTSFTGDRSDYKGVIEVRFEVLRQATYEQPPSALGETKGQLIESASVSLNVSTHDGPSEWDGPYEFTIQRKPPERIERYAFPRISAEHWNAMRRAVSTEMDGWPDARSTPGD